MRRVVVTGIGIISPLGVGSAASWQGLLAGTCGIRRIQAFDPGAFPSQVAGEVPPYKVGDFVPKSYRKATKVMARDIELAVVAADDAFRGSGIKSKAYTETPSFNPDRFGCNIGAGLISAELNELTAAFNVARDGGALDLKKWGVEGHAAAYPAVAAEVPAEHARVPRDDRARTQRPIQYDHLCRCLRASRHRRSLPHHSARRLRHGNLRRRPEPRKSNGLHASGFHRKVDRNGQRLP